MMKVVKILGLLLCVVGSTAIKAGNSDRAGESGAVELLLNPYARTMGMGGTNSAKVMGIDALGSNVAGLAYNKKLTFGANYLSWLTGSEISYMNASVASEISDGTSFGFNVNMLNFGKSILTTTANPDGNLGTFSPYMMNLGLSFAKRFGNVNGGITARLINEGISNISATGFSIDAGLQYITGEKNDLQFGVYIRNLGFPMQFQGDALAIKKSASTGTNYDLTFNQRAAKFDLPVQFSIAVNKDYYIGKIPTKNDFGYCNPINRLSVSGSFVYNAFIDNDYGVGVEYAYKERFMVRAGYQYQTGGLSSSTTRRAQMGITAGFTVNIPMSKDIKGSSMEISYNYRPTWVYNGTHNIGVTYYISTPSVCNLAQEKVNAIVAEIKEEPKLVEVSKPKTIIKYDTIIIREPAKVETKVEFKEINKILDDFAKNIEFKLASSVLSQKGEGAMDVIGDLIKKYPDHKFVISGHTDEMGTTQNNDKLSENRATAVAEYLIKYKEIAQKNLVVEWFGEEKPIADNSTEEGRKLNRRVEIYVFDPKKPSKYSDEINTIVTSEKTQPVKSVEKISKNEEVKVDKKETPKKIEKSSEKSKATESEREVKPTSKSVVKESTPVVVPVQEEEEVKPLTAQDSLNQFAEKMIFKTGTDSLGKMSKRNIEKLANYLKEVPAYKIKMIGHTDNSTYAVDNMQLSKNRVLAVKNELMSHGISEDRISIEYYGDTKPVASNDNEEGKQKNRRIEIVLVK